MIEWLTKDWGSKLIAFFLAVGLWYYAVGEEGIEVTRRVPLDIKVKNTQMSVLKTSAKSVLVTLVAPRALLSDLTSEKISAFHEIREDVKTQGDYSFRLEAREIKLPSPQIRVTRIEPEVIQVTLDELIVQKLVVKPNFVGEPAFGYKVNPEEVQLDPNAVLIEGPKVQLEKMDSIKTERIDLVGRIRSFRRTVELDLPPNVKPLSEVLIDIYVAVKEEFDEKVFENVPVKILRASESKEQIEVSPPAISFVLKGSKKQLEKLTGDKILAYADASPLGEGEHQIPVQMVLPQDVSLKDETPVTVKVAVKK